MIKWNILKVGLFLIPNHHLAVVKVYALYLGLVEVAFRTESADRTDYMRRFYASRYHLCQQRLSKEEIVPANYRKIYESLASCFL